MRRDRIGVGGTYLQVRAAGQTFSVEGVTKPSLAKSWSSLVQQQAATRPSLSAGLCQSTRVHDSLRWLVGSPAARQCGLGQGAIEHHSISDARNTIQILRIVLT